MDTTNTIRLKDRSVGFGVAALTLVACVFVYRSAADSHELQRLREQNAILTQQLRKLDVSFKRIRQYTKSAGALATAEISPRDLREVKDATLYSAASSPVGEVFGRVALAAKNAPGLIPGGTDLEGFAKTLTLVDGINRDTDVVVRRLGSLATILKYNKELMHQIPSMMPVEGRISSEFGVRLSPFGGARSMHAGVDIAAEFGSDVHAPADGMVTYVGEFDSLGQAIVISHGTSRVLTRYGHLSRTRVAVGQHVKRGDVIANSGNSGHSTGPHLHYEVWVKNVAVNPRDFFFDMTDTAAFVAQDQKAAKKAAQVAAADVDGDL